VRPLRPLLRSDGGPAMTTKAEERRIRHSFDRTRVRLKERQIELEGAEKKFAREREAAMQERVDAIALLQLLAEELGSGPVDPEASLAETIETKLWVPMVARVQKLIAGPVAAPQPAAAPAARRSPAVAPAPPRRLQAVPDSVHRVLVVEAEDAWVGRGYACRCVCAWISRVVVTQAEAWRLARDHEGGEQDRRAQAAR